jgi:hypothetical protein
VFGQRNPDPEEHAASWRVPVWLGGAVPEIKKPKIF